MSAHRAGTYTWHNGERYEGKFEGDQLQGPDNSSWPDGRYTGSFVDGQKSGTGEFEWPNGNRYLGEFANDEREGLGIFHWRDGTVYEGDFEHNRCMASAVKRQPDGEPSFSCGAMARWCSRSPWSR